jgi:3-methyladenine DNA glycosylase AlkD
MDIAEQVRQELRTAADQAKALVVARFFKTGPGEYGEGDLFLGVTVPKQRLIAKKHRDASLADISRLLQSKIHEERLTALLILTYQYPLAAPEQKKAIYDFYLKHAAWINNWDLIDVTCPHIIGAYLYDRDRAILYDLVRSSNLWERRMAVLACFYFIKRGQADDLLSLAGKLLDDRQDLIHKAAGWMLREVGKHCGEPVLRSFIDKYRQKMPRTMLRYAIERMQEKERQRYLIKTANIK